MSGAGLELEKARELLRIGRPDAAAAAALEHLAHEPEDPAGFAVLALAALDQRDLTAAKDAVEQAIAREPENDSWHYIQAMVRSAADDERGALASIERALEIDPEDPDNHGLHAQLLLANGRGEAALAAARAGLELDPEDHTCRVTEQDALVLLGRHDEVEQRLAAMLAADPDDAGVHERVADRALRRGDTAAAIEHYLAALRLVPDDDDCRRGLLEALRGRNRIYRPVLWLRLRLRELVARAPNVVVGALIVTFVVAARLGADVRPYFLGVLLVPTALSDLFLMAHPIARHALTMTQKVVALVVGALWLLASGLAIMGFVQCDPGWFTGALAALGISVIGAMFGFAIAHSRLDGGARWRVAIYVIVAAALVGVVIWRKVT